MGRTLLYILITVLVSTATSAATRKSAQVLALGETEVKVNVYENAGAPVTFFAPHYNEQTGTKLAKEFVAQNGGRVVEIESTDEKGNASRYVKFKFNNKIYTIDPNRIFTENGRACGGAAEIDLAVKNFADALLQIIFASDGKTLREGERFIVAVHNNVDVDTKAANAQANDLTAVAFIKAQSQKPHGIFSEQSDGVFLSNTETDADNFVFLSTPEFIGHFASRGFNVVVQKASAKLQSKQCSVDDGSMSVFAAQNNISYICLEADGVNGAFRQRQMLEAVYALLPAQKPIEQTTLAGNK